MRRRLEFGEYPAVPSACDVPVARAVGQQAEYLAFPSGQVIVGGERWAGPLRWRSGEKPGTDPGAEHRAARRAVDPPPGCGCRHCSSRSMGGRQLLHADSVELMRGLGLRRHALEPGDREDQAVRSTGRDQPSAQGFSRGPQPVA